MSEKQRLHPAAALEFMVRNLKYIVQTAVPVAVALFSMKMGEYLIAAVVAIGCLFVVYSAFSWLRFTYYVENKELRVEQGVLIRKKTYIPLERIHSVHVSAGIVQRLFGLVKLEMETAGGNTKAEVSLAALTKARAEELRMTLGHGKPDAAATEATEKTLVRKLSTRSLLVAASTTNGLWIAALGLFAILSQIDQFFPQVNVYELLGKSASNLAGSGIVAIVAVFAIILLAAWVLSIAGSAIRLWGYTISREGEIITVSRGLLERNQYTLPVRRIQAIALGESLLRQPFGLVSVEAVSFGVREKGSMTSQIFPLLRRKEVDGFMRQFLPEFTPEAGIEKVSRAALTSYMVPVLTLVLAITLVATVFVPYGHYSLLLLVPVALWAYARYRDAGWRLDRDMLIIRSRGLGRTTYLIAGGKIQSMTASRTFLQARRKLATMSVSIPTSYGGTNAYVMGIAEDKCALIMDWFKTRHVGTSRTPSEKPAISVTVAQNPENPDVSS